MFDDIMVGRGGGGGGGGCLQAICKRGKIERNTKDKMELRLWKSLDLQKMIY
jgi:hypothetical protein